MIYGHFIEHFHRQIYGGLYDPKSPFSDEKGLRLDVLEAMRKIKVPVLRWPGGCFASSYHWKDAVGPERKPYFDKAWRVEESNAFGTDEYMDLCEKLGCQPYICTNAGTGTSEEMSDWVEYCNLEREGRYAKWRSENGHPRPYGVKYWSIGNENYGDWEIGAKSAQQWGRLVKESAKMIKHIDPTTELTAAALTDLDWNISLLKNCSDFLDWISIHEYWDPLQEKNQCATYEEAMAYTNHVDDSIENIQGLLTAMNLKGKIKIAFDEWNLRSWYHPNVFHQPMGVTKEEYLTPRDENDQNATYTMADAVFSACFLNACNRHCDVVKMANFAPTVNTRGCIFTYDEGIVLRSTYHVFDLYVNLLGDTVVDCWCEDAPKMTVKSKAGALEEIQIIDALATMKKDSAILSLVNKDPGSGRALDVDFGAAPREYRLHTLTGKAADSYNNIGKNEIFPVASQWLPFDGSSLTLPPHSVTIAEYRF